MTTGRGNRGNNGHYATVRDRMVTIGSYGGGILIILFMGNLSALIDAVIHPDINYFNKEHFIVGGVTALVTSVLFIIVMIFLSRLRRKETELQKLNDELEKKVAERTRQLVESQDKLLKEEKLAMLGRIAGNMGNELKNPLGVMNNAVFFLQTLMPDANETVREYLEIIGKEIYNSQSIISELLDYCQGRSPRTEPVAVQELIHQSRKRCTIPENIMFLANLPETLPHVQVDPRQMEQVFQHLITNAVQAMPEGGELRIAARQIMNDELRIMSSDSKFKIQNSKFDGDFVEISVTDSGEGIAPENMEKLFQPLFSTRSRGVGLGLAIAQKLTEANGGRIGVISEVDKGSTFNVVLPAGTVGHER